VGTQYQAGVGYDLTTGLGSVNVANLVTNWNTVTFNPTTTLLTLNNSAAVNITHGHSVSFQATVTPSSGTGTPTGVVTLLSGNGLSPSTMQLFTVSGGLVASSISDLPGGSNYNVWAHYGGDETYAPSDSAPVLVTTVGSEPSATTLSVLSQDANGNPVPFSGGPFGSFVYLRADVTGQSGKGIPTGSVTFLDSNSPIVAASSLALNSQGNTATPNGILNFDTGTHSITASYSGDASFSPSSTSPPISFTITPGFYAVMPSNQPSVLVSAPGSSGSTSVAVSSSTGFTGTITLTCSGLPTGAACVFAPSSIKSPGTPGTTSAALTVTTTAATAAMLDRPRHGLFARATALSGFMLFSIVLIGGRGRRRLAPMLLALLTAILLTPGCGGGGSSTPPPPPPNPATPAGTYTIMVSASSGATTSTTSFTLFVQ
jgi:hypothetical protein